MQAVLTHLRLLAAADAFSLLLVLCFGVFDSLVFEVVRSGGDSDLISGSIICDYPGGERDAGSEIVPHHRRSGDKANQSGEGNLINMCRGACTR